MKTYHVKGIKWDCDDADAKDCNCPTEAYISANNMDEVVDNLTDRYGYYRYGHCVKSVDSITESTPEKAVEQKTNELLDQAVKMAKSKIKKALNCGAVDVESYDDDYELPKIILHAVMKSMADETMPLYPANRKESNNLYQFL